MNSAEAHKIFARLAVDDRVTDRTVSVEMSLDELFLSLFGMPESEVVAPVTSKRGNGGVLTYFIFECMDNNPSTVTFSNYAWTMIQSYRNFQESGNGNEVVDLFPGQPSVD